MNCFYCNNIMELSNTYYFCDKRIGPFGHYVVFDLTKEKNINISFHCNKIGFYQFDFRFYSEKSFLWDKINEKNIFLQEQDFDVLKTITNQEQLQKFVDKLKVFK